MSVDLDPNNLLASQIGNIGKDDSNPNRPLAAQKKNVDEHDVPDINAALKELFSKRTAGMKQKEDKALERDGKDVNVAHMDPEKLYTKVKKMESDPPLKEEYANFFKVCIKLPLVFYFIALSPLYQVVTPAQFVFITALLPLPISSCPPQPRPFKLSRT